MVVSDVITSTLPPLFQVVVANPNVNDICGKSITGSESPHRHLRTLWTSYLNTAQLGLKSCRDIFMHLQLSWVMQLIPTITIITSGIPGWSPWSPVTSLWHQSNDVFFFKGPSFGYFGVSELCDDILTVIISKYMYNIYVCVYIYIYIYAYTYKNMMMMMRYMYIYIYIYTYISIYIYDMYE